MVARRHALRVCLDPDGNSEIYVASRDGSNVRRITNNAAIDISPTWSPNGTEIAFTSDRSGSPEIYTVSADGLGSVQRLTERVGTAIGRRGRRRRSTKSPSRRATARGSTSR